MMTATIQAEASTCPHCNGRGEFACFVQWSDGLGGASQSCSICDGKGVIDFDPVKQLAELKTHLKSLIYNAWLVAGCRTKRITSSEARVWNVPSQGLCNELLRQIKELPVDLHPTHEQGMSEIT